MNVSRLKRKINALHKLLAGSLTDEERARITKKLKEKQQKFKHYQNGHRIEQLDFDRYKF